MGREREWGGGKEEEEEKKKGDGLPYKLIRLTVLLFLLS